MVLLVISVLSAYMLNAEILFSLKNQKFSFKENALQITFDFVLLLLIFFRYLGIPLVIIFMSCFCSE
jgi:hypothetical protein